jgi:magnesium chelatase subunit I
VKAAVVVTPVADAVRKPNFPFVRIAGQDEMKLAICLNVVDPNIGGVLIMGDRGTGKSVTASHISLALRFVI